MAFNALPSVEVLRQFLVCDPEAGTLTWLKRDGEERTTRTWNSRFAGEPAFNQLSPRGYLRGEILGISSSAHRVIWKMATGLEPNVIDHINGVQTDNRLVNLRSVSQAVNTRNRKLPIHNKTGYHGVCWHKRDKKFRAQISIAGRKVTLGSFSRLEDAVAARKAAERVDGYCSHRSDAMTKKNINDRADTTDRHVSDTEAVSRTEHAMGSRQPDTGEYDEQREQPPLEGRDVPQKIVTADNDTPTPGETGKAPTGKDVINEDK